MVRVGYPLKARIDDRDSISYCRVPKEYLRLEISDCRVRKSTIINLISRLSVIRP
jgi:hypothetical protein